MASADPIAATWERGLARHRAGDLHGASAAYREVLAARPHDGDAGHMLGVVALQSGDLDRAERLLRRTVLLDPSNPGALNNFASLLRRRRRLGQAAAMARWALRLDPALTDAMATLANILGEQGDHGGAAAVLQTLVALKPRLVDPRLDLARHLILCDRAEEATEALLDLLGVRPASVPAYTNLGVALRRLGRLEEAVAAYRSGLGFAPDDVGLLNNLGIALGDLGHRAEARRCLRRALALDPASATGWVNLSLLARAEMEMAAATAGARRAVRLAPTLAEAQVTLAFALLMTGRFAEGLAAYEWRGGMAKPSSPPRRFAAPLWTGGDPAGRRLVLHDEQGVGDAIQFARFAPLLQARGATVYLECNRQLSRLFRSLRGVAGVVERFGALPPHDGHAPLLSLPFRLGTRAHNVPAGIPYLFAEPALRAHWAARLAVPRAVLRVGLVWAGNPEFKGDALRSPGLAPFRALLGTSGCAFFALQKGAGREELSRGPVLQDLDDLGPSIGDFADTAAIMDNLDLVISSCTGPAHLAGALGRPVWTVLPFSPDWRWLERGDTSPWYPTMRLFRQDRPGDWSGVMERVRLALAGLVAVRSMARRGG